MLKPITSQEAFEIIVSEDTQRLFFRQDELNTCGKIPRSFERVDDYKLDITEIGKCKFYIFEEIKED